MKTAVSIPDPIFRQAERFAKKNRMTRSALYAAALANYMNGEKPEQDITARLNEIFGPDGKGSELDPQLAAYTARRIRELTKDDTW